jgi:hypothetical protein
VCGGLSIGFALAKIAASHLDDAKNFVRLGAHSESVWE